jgi:hypothetical protein
MIPGLLEAARRSGSAGQAPEEYCTTLMTAPASSEAAASETNAMRRSSAVSRTAART